MSTNIHFYGQREIQVVKTGHLETQTMPIEVWQTPSRVTREILAAEDPVAAYVSWALRDSKDIEEKIYADFDFMQVGGAIGTRVYNPAQEHARAFLDTVNAMRDAGYEIVAEGW